MEETAQQNTPPQQMRVTLSKRKIMIVLAVIAVIAFVAAAYFFSKNQGAEGSKVIAEVGDTPVYQSYLDEEIKLYPKKVTPEVKKQLLDKVIKDTIILQAAKKEKKIQNAYETPVTTTDAYLQRTKAAQDAQALIDSQAQGIKGSIVSIWFLNNGIIGPLGYERGKQIAFEKISALHKKVMNKEITMREAGQLIITDPQLKKLDPSYKENAFTQFHATPGKSITFWKPFDAMLWKLQPGGTTPVYAGDDTDPQTGKLIPVLYMFGQVSEKIASSNITSFESWYAQQKKQYEVTYN